jgi:nucleoside diphosphate kinase
MNDELSYVIITPYTIVKSRTGGVVSRLLSRIDLDFVAAQMLAPTSEMAHAYADYIMAEKDNMKPGSAELLSEYILRTFCPSEGRRHRIMMLLFRGPNACRKLSDIAGALFPENLSIESIKGETIRDTYADLIWSRTEPGRAEYFEPAVMTPPSMDRAIKALRLWAEFARDEPNLVENMRYPDPSMIQRTLVIIKPDNWRSRSTKPGSIIDMFSRTGLRIIGIKLYQMSVAEAMEFYAPVRQALIERLGPNVAMKAKALLEKEFNLPLPDEVESSLLQTFGRSYAEDQFSQIVEFMSGRRPEDLSKADMTAPGLVKSMLMVYEGKNAVSKIRDVLGPTDPTKAPGGTVRADFGSSIMVNTAHASDSPENAAREMRIVRIQENSLSPIILDYLATVEQHPTSTGAAAVH